MDSLPYVDVVQDDYEQYALSLIEDEMKVTQPTRMDLEEVFPVNFRTPAMQHEYQRFVDNSGQSTPQKIEETSANGNKPIDPPEGENVEAWRNAVQQARIGYECERARSMALEAKKDAGAALLWKGFNGSLDTDVASVQESLASQRQTVEQINLQRSEDQQTAGKQLHILATQYQTALERRFQLQQATIQLEQEIQQQAQ